MISANLVNEVHTEAAKLRESATANELRRVTITHLRPNNFEQCIYGLATGDCRSKRAIQLIIKCAPVVISEQSMKPKEGGLVCKPKYAGKASIRRRSLEWGWCADSYSPIEAYILQKGADNAALVRYLKGKTETLDLSHTINC